MATAVPRQIRSPLEGIDESLRALSAQEQAALRWLGPSIRKAASRLLDEPWNDALVPDVCREFLSALGKDAETLTRAFRLLDFSVLGDTSDEVIVAVKELLAPYRAEEYGEYVIRAMDAAGRAIGGALADPSSPIGRFVPTQQDVAEFADSRFAPVIAPTLVAVALLEAVSRRRSDQRIADLTLRAFGETLRLVDALRLAGIHVDPYASLPPEAAGRRAIAAARIAAETLDEDDQKILREARMRPWT